MSRTEEEVKAIVADSRAVELLAPAGNEECLHAAVCAGADAVYLGLEEFNARRNAGNFTLEKLQGTCRYAHLRGVAVYVTMNVEILPRELEQACSAIQAAWRAGADAFIVQDIGLAWEIKRRWPFMPLHASTQMNIHSIAGVEMAALLGLRRITLARELSVAEIASLSEAAVALGMETECFVHGALCVCYSGQCLMSSMIGGRSANRGLCAQPCRLPYELHRDDQEGALATEGEHLLSPRDLCGGPLVEALIDAGVASLKIEGRMKSADYVAETVATYREVIDSRRFTETHQMRLGEAFSRGFTTAYLEGEHGNAMMSYGRPNNRGMLCGRVTSVAGNAAEVKAERDLNAGDLVEFWTRRGHFTASVDRPWSAGDTAVIPVNEPVGKGDRVFRVRNAKASFHDEPFAPRIAITGEIVLKRGQPLHLAMRTAKGISAEAFGAVVEEARTKALSTQEVREHVGRLGQTPFHLGEDGENLIILMDEGVGMGFSALHRLRTEVLSALEQELLSTWDARRNAEADASPDAEPPAQKPSERATPSVRAWVTNPEAARAARKAGAEEAYVPLLNFKRGQATECGVRRSDAAQAGYPKQCIMALPIIDHDPTTGNREGEGKFDPWDYIREGKPVFADSLGDIWRALQTGALVEAGPHVPVTNRASLDFLSRLGISRVWLSPELSLGQLSELAENSPVPLGLFISGFQKLMVTEHCVLMAQGPCNQRCEACERRGVAHHLTDRKGFDFPVTTDMLGRSSIYNGVEFDGVGSLCDLMAMGVDAFMVDSTWLNREQVGNAVRRVIRAMDLCRKGGTPEKRRGTTTGHLHRGVQ